MKTSNYKHSFWLCGYFDDFQGARSIADDLNQANVRTHDHTKTHYGSVFGAENTLNPRYRFSFADRLRTNHWEYSDPNITSDNLFNSTSINLLRRNTGLHEWLTIDVALTDSSDYEKRASFQIPTSLVGNRYKWNKHSSDSYLAFLNGHDTSGTYYAPLGDIDPTFGGSPYLNADENYLPSNHLERIGGHVRIAQEDSAQWGLAQIHNNFTSIYTGEAPLTPLDLTDFEAGKLMQNIQSPSRKQFLVNSLYSQASSGTERLLTYTGDLRMRGVGEMFHLRFAQHKICDSTFDNYILKIGYKPTATYNKSTDNFDDTTVLAEVDIDFSALFLAQTHDAWAYPAGIEISYDETSIWVDVFVAFDFVAGTWKAYANDSTTHFDSGSIGSVDMATAKGWSLDAKWSALGSGGAVVVDTLIDRAAVMLPLSWQIDGTAMPPTESFDMRMQTNSIGSCTVSFSDDDHNYALSALTTGSSATEWRMLMFRDSENRPIWSGIIDEIAYKQDNYSKKITTRITARDSASILDRVLPVWEVGQNAVFSLNNHISMSATLEKRYFETKALENMLSMGATPMIFGNSELGFSSYDSSGSTKYLENPDSRMRLFSGSAIQMYNNENETGPNNVEDEWEGKGGDYVFLDVHGIRATDPTSNVVGVMLQWTDTTGAPSAGISTFKGISVGNDIVLKGTAYDGTLRVADMKVHAHSFGSEYDISGLTYFIELYCTSSGATPQTGYFKVGSIMRKSTDYKDSSNSYLLQFNCTINHGLNVGDQFQLFNFEQDLSTLAQVEGYVFTVSHVESATEIHCVVPNTYDGGALETYTGTVDSILYAEPFTSINSHRTWSPPIVKPVVIKDGEGLLTDTILQRVKHRNIHARWMRDLPLSPYFKAQFGVINAAPLWRAGKESNLQHPLSAQYITAHGSSGYNSDGTVQGWTGLNATIDETSTSIVLQECGMWWHWKTNNLEHGIVELLDIETNDSQYVIADTISDPQYEASLSWDGISEFQQTGSPTYALNKGDIVVHTGFYDERLNGVFRVQTYTSGTKKYQANKITQFEPTVNEYAFMASRYLGESTWNYGSPRHYQDPDGVRYKQKRMPTDFDSTPAASTTNGTMHTGQVTLSNVKGIRREWKQDHTIYSLRSVNESAGYKHLYVLWADMRNDGTADADGGLRKNKFGLILPTTQNYQVSMTIADQVDENGEPDIYTELKIGEEIDVWSFDAQNEPYSGGDWCALGGGSNSEPLDTRYHNWDEKGGSFIIIDASRYFNLNTAATNGRSGYASGGMTDFGDITLAVAATPTLIDNYFKNAAATYKNRDTTKIPQHPNGNYFLNEATLLTKDIALNDTTIYVSDNSLFATSGYGAIIAQVGDGRGAEDLIYYFSWTGKGVDANLGDTLTGVYVTSYQNSQSFAPNTLETLIAAEVAAGGTGSLAEIDLKDETGTGTFELAYIYTTTAALFPLRVVLNIQGTVISENQGTYYAHDKLRTVFNLMTSDTFAKNTALPCIYGLAGVPITDSMTTTQIASAGGDTDSFGSVMNVKGQTMLSILNEMSDKAGNGTGGETATFTWGIHRDNMISFRPRYDSGLSLSRSDLTTSDMVSKMGMQITNVRVFFNGNSNFVDYPEPSGNDASRWRILQHPKVFSRDEALSLAQAEYLREQQSNISVTAKVLRKAGESDSMLYGARYGYVQDVFRRFYHFDKDSNASWMNRWGGMPFSGSQNALNTVAGVFDLPALGSRTGVAYTLLDSDTPMSNGIEVRTSTYGENDTTPTANEGELVLTWTGSVQKAKWDKSGTGSYGAEVNLSVGWNTVSEGADDLTIYLRSGFTGTSGTYATTYTQPVPHKNGYHHYGTNSLAQCLAVTHIDKGVPKVSDTSQEELRLAITVESGTTPDDAKYRIWMLDYSFYNIPTNNMGQFTPPTKAATLEGSSSILIEGSGLYRMAVPSSYASSGSVVFSVDAEYLRAVLRKMTTFSSNNAHNLTGDTTYSSFDTDSPFPLGHRKYAHYHSTTTTTAANNANRTAYYAPRLSVVDDINYIPSTTVSYTDANIDLSAEKMVINSVNWSQKDRQVESVSLNLERTERHFGYSLARVFKEGGGANRPTRPEMPPPTTPSQPRSPPVSGGVDSTLPRQRVGGGSSEDYALRLQTNMLTNGFTRTLKGRGSFKSDTLLPTGDFAILGAQKPVTAISADRDIDGIESSPAPVEGSAIMTVDGFILAGINDPEVGAQGESHKHSTNVRVPNDVATGIINVDGIISLESITGGGSAVITTTVSCRETGASVSQTTTVAQGADRKSTTLVNNRFLDGAGTAGNTINIEVSRKPAQGSDTAGYQSLTVHTLSLRLRRNSVAGQAQSLSMNPF